MDRNVLLTAIAKAAAKAVTDVTIPHGEKVKLDTTVKLRFVGEISRDKESPGSKVDTRLDGYAVLFVLVEAGLIPGVHTRVVKDVIDAALAIKDGNTAFAEFKGKVYNYLPQKLQPRAAAVRVNGNIIDFEEVTR